MHQTIQSTRPETSAANRAACRFQLQRGNGKLAPAAPVPLAYRQIREAILRTIASGLAGATLLLLATPAFGAECATYKADYGGTSITIQNNLTSDLVYSETKNRQGIKIWMEPPSRVAAGTSGCFVVAVGDSFKNQHLNIGFDIDGKAGENVHVIFKHLVDADKHCPKEHPDWVVEKVKNCGHWDDRKDGKLWTYVYDVK